MKPLSASEFQKLEQLFDEGLAVPAEEREAWMQSRCGTDASAAQWLRGMFSAEAGETSSSTVRFGPYRMLRKLGQGGMGTVFLAERDDGQYERQVAVKTLSGPFRSAYLMERFRQECRILASLDHPNIARLLDSGIDASGQPYLVMEYVDGELLDRYAAQVPRAAQLDLFLKICEAVRFAHQRLIVHRDLKPSNILVTGDGVVKLLDFGTARLLDDSNTGNTIQEWRTFTPEYASPEQVTGRYIGTASDVYSLGVILYRLLTGRAPYTITDRSPATIAQVVLESGASPSGLDPDLDAILSRAMRKDAEDRYQSVDELAEDVRRYRDGQPVLARRGDRWYRLRKLAFRYRWYVGGAAAALFLVTVGAGAVFWQYRIAEARNAELRRLTGTVLSEFFGQVTDLPGSAPAQRVLVGRALESLDRLAKESGDDPWIRRRLADGYVKLAGLLADPYIQNLGDVKGGLENAEKALRILALQPGDRESRQIEALALRTKAAILYGSGGGGALEAAKASASACGELNDLQCAAFSWSVVGDIQGQVGTYSQGSLVDAIAAYERAKASLEELLRAKPDDQQARRSLNGLRIKLGNIVMFSNPEKAIVLFQAASEEIQRMAMDVQRRAGMRRMLGLSEAKLARAKASLQRADAKENAARALEIARGFAAISPGDTRAQDDLALSYFDNGVVAESLGDAQSAALFYRQAAMAAAELRRKRPDNPRARSIDEESRAIAGLWNPDLFASGQAALAQILERSRGEQGKLFDWDTALGIATHPRYRYQWKAAEFAPLARQAVEKSGRNNAYYLTFQALITRDAADARAALARLGPERSIQRQRLEAIAASR